MAVYDHPSIPYRSVDDNHWRRARITENLFFAAGSTRMFPPFFCSRRDIERRITRNSVPTLVNRLIVRLGPSMRFAAFFNGGDGFFCSFHQSFQIGKVLAKLNHGFNVSHLPTSYRCEGNSSTTSRTSDHNTVVTEHG